MAKRFLLVVAALALPLMFSATAAANHGPMTGHLPPTVRNVDLVGKANVTGAVDDAVTDVATYRDTAYLGRWPVPDCPGGFWSVDISDPRNPRELTFVQSPPDAYLTEGLHALRLTTPAFNGEVLVVSQETCLGEGDGGVSIYNVTNPANPQPLSLGRGDTDGGTRAHDSHSAFAWDAGDRAFVAFVDNEEGVEGDIDIMEITDPRNPVLIRETGLADWPGIEVDGYGQDAGVHDLVVRRVEGDWMMLVSYWDAGYVVLNVNDPANPVFVKDTNYPDTDPLTGVPRAEGNGHEAEWDRCPEEGVRSRFPCGDVRYILGADEDFSPFRPVVEVAGLGVIDAGEFGFTPSVATMFPNGVTGPTVWGGSGCVEDLNGNGTPDRAEVPPRSSIVVPAGQEPVIVFSRGVCFFSDKIRSGELAGYRVVVIGNTHAGAGGGLFPDAFFCGGQGSPIAGTAVALCIGHQTMHRLFGDPPNYAGPNFVDMPALGTRGSAMTIRGGVFDGWGYLNLFNADTMAFMDAYAVPEALDPRFATGFGDLSIHEITTDPTGDVGYIAWYSAGFRVVSFRGGNLREVGRHIDVNGNDHWGIELNVRRDGRLFALASDRDYGLYIYRFGTDLRPRKVSTRRVARVGQTFSYRLRIANSGTIGETRTIVRDRLPRGVSFVGASATQGRCSYRAAARTVVCNLGRLRNDAGAAFVTIRVRAARPGLWRNTALVQGREAEYDVGNNRASTRTRVLRAPAPRLTGGR